MSREYKPKGNGVSVQTYIYDMYVRIYVCICICCKQSYMVPLKVCLVILPLKYEEEPFPLHMAKMFHETTMAWKWNYIAYGVLKGKCRSTLPKFT